MSLVHGLLHGFSVALKVKRYLLFTLFYITLTIKLCFMLNECVNDTYRMPVVPKVSLLGFLILELIYHIVVCKMSHQEVIYSVHLVGIFNALNLGEIEYFH